MTLVSCQSPKSLPFSRGSFVPFPSFPSLFVTLLLFPFSLFSRMREREISISVQKKQLFSSPPFLSPFKKKKIKRTSDLNVLDMLYNSYIHHEYVPKTPEHSTHTHTHTHRRKKNKLVHLFHKVQKKHRFELTCSISSISSLIPLFLYTVHTPQIPLLYDKKKYFLNDAFVVRSAKIGGSFLFFLLNSFISDLW